MKSSFLIQAARSAEECLGKYPAVAKAVARIIPLPLLLGKRYRQYRRQFDRTDVIPDLLKMVNFAFREVPFYREKYRRVPATLKEFEEEVGFTSKADLRSRLRDFLSPRFDSSRYELVTTSGSTGEPSVFYLPKDRFYKEWAYIHKIWEHRGYRGQLRGVLRNHSLTADEVYRVRVFRREVIFDAYRNNPDYYRQIWETLKKYKLRYFQSYPHLAGRFFRFVREEGLDVSFLKGVFLSSERLHPHQRTFLTGEMRLPVTSLYGLSEKIALAADYDGSGQYHIIESYGYVELVDAEGKVIKQPGTEGEIVATTLDNYGMPLIRFRTGDVSAYSVYERGKRILDGIKGRKGEFIYNPDGTGVSVTSLNMHGDLLQYIRGLQFYQPEAGHVEIRIIPADDFHADVERRIREYYRQRFHPAMQVRLIKTHRLEILPNGKLPVLISRVKPSDLKTLSR